MMTEKLRPLREDERKALHAMLEAPSQDLHTGRYLLIWLGVLAGTMVLAAVLVMLAPHPVIGGLVGGVLAMIGLVCVYAVIQIPSAAIQLRIARRHFSSFFRPIIESTLLSGMVLSKRIAATSVIELCEFEDEGSGYIFGVGGKESFLLKAQWAYPSDEAMPWPCTDFEIVRSTDGKLLIGIFCSGVKLEPVRVVELTECREEFVRAELEEAVAKPPETVLEDILKRK
jgi:hypothetical protein